MDLSYEYLKNNVVEVELNEDLNMGPKDDFVEDNGNAPWLTSNSNGEAIIPKGLTGTLCVQPFNNWYEMTIDGLTFDVAVEDDELNSCFKTIKVLGPNEYFVNK